MEQRSPHEQRDILESTVVNTIKNKTYQINIPEAHIKLVIGSLNLMTQQELSEFQQLVHINDALKKPTIHLKENNYEIRNEETTSGCDTESDTPQGN